MTTTAAFDTTTVGQAPPAARAVDATKRFGAGTTQVLALDHITCDFPAGRLTAIMGPSGSGKSTLLHCMAGLEALSSGQVFVGGTDLSQLSDRDLTELRRDRIGFVFQSFNLVPTLDARRNILLQLRLGRRAVDPDWFDSVIGTLGLENRLHHRPAELSGGQQQRVAVARALIGRPEIIFADEPTGNLDTRSSGEVLQFLRRAVDDLSQTVVMVTHDATAAAIADRVLFLEDGRIVDEMFDPTTGRLLDRMKAFGE